MEVQGAQRRKQKAIDSVHEAHVSWGKEEKLLRKSIVAGDSTILEEEARLRLAKASYQDLENISVHGSSLKEEESLLGQALDELWGLKRDLEEAGLRAVNKSSTLNGEVVSTSELMRRSNEAMEALV